MAKEKKIILTDEEFNKLPDDLGTVISDEEMMALPSDEPIEKEDDGSWYDPALEAISVAGEYVDRYTGAPARSAISAAQYGENPIEAFAEQFGEPTEGVPSGKDIVLKAGVSDEPFIGDISPADALGFGMDIAADPTLGASAALKGAGLAAKSITPVRVALKGRAGKAAFKSLAQISSNAKVRDVFLKNRAEIIGQHLLQSELGPSLNNPAKLLERIKGKETVKYTRSRLGKKNIDTPMKTRSGGLISNISKETEDILQKVSPKVDKVDVNQMVDDLVNKDIKLRMDPEAAEKFSPKDAQKYESMIKQFLKPLDGEERTVIQLQNLKKALGKKLQSKEFFAPESKKLALEKNAMQDVYHTLKRTIENSISGVPVQMGDDMVDAGLLIGNNNQKITSLMDVGALLENIPASEMRSANTAQKVVDTLVSAGAGTTAAAITGSPYVGMAAAGTAYGISKTGKGLASKIPAMEANIIDAFINPTLPKKSLISPTVRGAGMMSEESVGREPQSIPEELIRTPLPRTSDEIMEKRDFVLAKTAQQAPELYDHLKDLLDNDPDIMRDTLPLLAQQAPHLFVRDKYNRIDGVIMNPEDKMRATKDTMDRDDLSNNDKIRIINDLNKTGVFHDY